VHRALEAVLVPDIADEEAEAGVGSEKKTGLVLLQFVSRKNDNSLGVVMIQNVTNEGLAKGPSATSNED